MFKVPSDLTADDIRRVKEIPNYGSSSHTFNPVVPMLLSENWVTVTADWVSNIPAEGVSIDPSTGVFELTTVGRWKDVIERIYHQHDTNPTTPIMIYIKIQTSLDKINWVDTDFERSSIISAATKNDEPAVQSFTTNLLVDVADVPVYFRLQVKADEGGGTPDQTELILMKVTSNIISKVPA